MAKRDASTIDLFREFEPPPAVQRFNPERVRAATLSMLLARAVSEALGDYSHSRAVVAQELSEYLGESVSTAMLDKYASMAAAGHTIPAHRLVALAVVTGDARLLNALVAEAGFIAVPARYEALIRRELAKEAADRLTRDAAAADAQWRAGR